MFRGFTKKWMSYLNSLIWVGASMLFFVSVKSGLNRIPLLLMFCDLDCFYLLLKLALLRSLEAIYPVPVYLCLILFSRAPWVIEKPCATLNTDICSCFVLCKHYQTAIGSVYHSSSTSPKEPVADLTFVLEELSQHISTLFVLLHLLTTLLVVLHVYHPCYSHRRLVLVIIGYRAGRRKLFSAGGHCTLSGHIFYGENYILWSDIRN